MCEIFPEVESCCGVASVRVGMLLIAVLSITTGALSICALEQKFNYNFANAFMFYENMSHYERPQQVISEMAKLINLIIACMAAVFMFAGLALMFATLSDQEGFAQIFVWMVFLNICVGFLIIIAISFECAYGGKCLLEGLDWLTVATCMLGLVVYLMVWYYFCCVANSYVLNAYT